MGFPQHTLDLDLFTHWNNLQEARNHLVRTLTELRERNGELKLASSGVTTDIAGAYQALAYPLPTTVQSTIFGAVSAAFTAMGPALLERAIQELDADIALVRIDLRNSLNELSEVIR